MTKGILLAGGKGTRLYPLTIPIVKQLLPVYDKPMIYYPLSTLMLAGIREFLLISNPEDIPAFQKLLGDGSQLGISITYAKQDEPKGIGEAFLIGEEFIGEDPVWLILGDNLFFGHGLPEILQKAYETPEKSTVFAYHVSDPERYGVVDFDEKGQVLSIEEKPTAPKSNYAVTGLYYYPKGVTKATRNVSPSRRGELEITDLNTLYLKENQLKVQLLGRGFAWLDTGTYDSLLEASKFVSIVQNRQNYRIGCIEEIAYHLGYIDVSQLQKLTQGLSKTSYGEYLEEMIQNNK